MLEGAMSEEDLIAKFLDLYEGDEEQMRREVSAFLKQLAEIGVLE
ncbi:MAG: PqqD family protein [Bacteroidales bacterium]